MAALSASSTPPPRPELERLACVGACTLLVHNYIRAKRFFDVTMFLVAERCRSVADGCVWTAPLGAVDDDVLAGTPAAVRTRTAARELFEELHVKIDEETLASSEHFTEVLVPFRGRRSGEWRTTAAFVARQPLPETYMFGKAEFHKRRQAYEDVPATAHAGAFLETQDVAHVPVVQCLAAVAAARSDMDVRVQDVHGNDLVLRRPFVHILRHPDVRKALLDAVSRSAGLAVTIVPPPTPAPPAPALDHKLAQAHAVVKTPTVPLWDAPYERHDNLHLVMEAPTDADKLFRLFVGDHRAAGIAGDRIDVAARLKSLGVTHIVNCCPTDFHNPSDWTPLLPFGFRYALLHTNDMAEPDWRQDPRAQWHGILSFLRECRDGGGAALVHCYAGMNRSVTTAALFMATHGFATDIDDAVARIRARRRVASPYEAYVSWARGFLTAFRDADAATAAALAAHACAGDAEHAADAE